MIFKQLFDEESYSYSYLMASRYGGEALLIDPVETKSKRYLKLLDELNLNLVKAIDTHCHADHISALGSLRDATDCITVMGEKSSVDLVSIRVEDGDEIEIENIKLRVIYTPGHTDDSYCFLYQNQIFTGDTLLIRGTGRTDFQNGDPYKAYDSIFNKLLKLNDETIIWPGHDYKGDTSSTIGEERAYNPRLQVSSSEEYAKIMNNLNLPNPKMMDVAVPANLNIGLEQDGPDILRKTLTPSAAKSLIHSKKVLCIDIREHFERKKIGSIPGSLHVPYTTLKTAIKSDGLLFKITQESQKSLLIYCSYGERSALALKLLQKAEINDVFHLGGGINSWKKWQSNKAAN